MLKKLLFSSFVAASFAANAQVLFQESFGTGWAQRGYSLFSGCDPIASATPPVEGKHTFDAVLSNFDTTLTYNGLNVKYTVISGGILPNCPTKNTVALSAAEQVWPGYVELNKSSGTKAAGSIVTSVLPNVTTVNLEVSSTGSNRFFQLAKSKDNGVTWDTIYNSRVGTTAAPAVINLNASGAGFYGIEVNEFDVMLGIFGNYNIIRVHEMIVNGSAAGLSKTSLFDNGASVTVDDNKMTVLSPKNATVQIVNANGVAVAQADVNGEATFNIAQSGMYIVRLTSDNKVSTKKVIVQ